MYLALGIQRAKRMRHIATCCLSGYTTFFFYILINGTIFEKKKVIEHKMCFDFSLQLLPEIFLILRRNERDMIKKFVLVFM